MPNSFVTLFGEYGLPAPNGLVTEFESNSFVERLPRYSAWAARGVRRRKAEEAEGENMNYARKTPP